MGVGTIAWALCYLQRVRLKRTNTALAAEGGNPEFQQGNSGQVVQGEGRQGDGPARPNTRVRVYPTVRGHPVTGHASVNGGSQVAQRTEDPNGDLPYYSPC